MKIKLVLAAAGMVMALAPITGQALPFADTVVSFSGGSGFGVYDQSGGSYGGASGAGVFDPSAVTGGLDGAVLALGGETGPAGTIVVSFSTGAVVNGAGSDLRIYDTFGLSEGLTVEGSANGTTFSFVGTFGGDFSIGCSPSSPCATDFDLAASGLTQASFFRITVVQSGGGCVGNFPECYDLDAVEALNFGTSAVPEPGTLAVLVLGLGLVGFSRRWQARKR